MEKYNFWNLEFAKQLEDPVLFEIYKKGMLDGITLLQSQLQSKGY